MECTHPALAPVAQGFFNRQRMLNLISALFLAGAFLMLGKSCWIKAKAEVAQVLLHRAFQQSIVEGKPVKAWQWADTWPMAELRVPRLKASAIVLQGSSTEALAFGPAYLTDTALPGAPGTTVLAAHRDTHFAFLRDVKMNDLIEITRSDGLTFSYRVTKMRVATWNASGIGRSGKGHHLVLTTCYPFDAITRGDQRFIVEAEMVV